MVKFCKNYIDGKRLKGILQTFWKPTIEEYRKRILKGVDLVGDAKRKYY